MNYSNEYWKKNPSFHKEDAPRKFVEITSLINYTPKTIVDIGCGAGYLTNLIFNKYRPIKMVGIDISKEAIDIAREISPKNIDYRSMNLMDFEIKEKFELGYLADLLEHIEDDKEILKKLLSFCKTLIIRVPLEHNFYNDFLKFIHISDEYKSFEKRYGHIHHYNLSDLNTLFSKCGIKVEEFKLFPLGKRTKRLNNLAVYISKVVRLFSHSLSASIFGGFAVFRVSQISN